MCLHRLAATVALVLCEPLGAEALERWPVRLADLERSEPWNVGCTSTIAYYNTCAGWAWAWSGWEPESRIGVSYTSTSACSDGGPIVLWHWMYLLGGSPSGYGYTGAISIYAADDDLCPVGQPLATQVFLPIDGWDGYVWGVYGPQVTVLATLGPAENNPAVFVTDAPSVSVPGGPISCGSCYPENRITHSFYFGSTSAPLCPGSPFIDGACNAELLWQLVGTLVDDETPVSVRAESWAKIKSLYR